MSKPKTRAEERRLFRKEWKDVRKRLKKKMSRRQMRKYMHS